MSDDMIVFEKQGPITVGTIRSDNVLDAQNIVEFGRLVLEYVQVNAGLALVLDFVNVRYLSSAVLTELIRINRAINESNGMLRLCTLSEDIRKVFEITNLDKVFVIEDKLAKCLTRLERALAVKAEEEAWRKTHKDF